MATSYVETKCSICDDDGDTSCKGCSKDFCLNHLVEHRRFLNDQLGLIQHDYNQFRQNLIDMKNDSKEHPSIKEINQWESDSITKIQQKANEYRQLLNGYINKSMQQIEVQLNETNQLFTINEKQKKNFNEIHLTYLKEKLEELKKQLTEPGDISIEQKQESFISEISVRFIHKSENGQGDRNDQLNRPTKVIIDQQTDSLIICDWRNRRVVKWPRSNGKTGSVLISNILCWDLIMDKYGNLYVSDAENHKVIRWKVGEAPGTIVAGGNGQGFRLGQLNNPTNIFIDKDDSIFVSDKENHRVMKWVKGAKEGIVVAGGHGLGNRLKQLSHPRGIFVDQLGTLYVADSGNGRVMRWTKGADEGTIVVGGNGRGEQINLLNQPSDISFDRENNLYVVEFGNHRVQKFDLN